jgi:hypothetical protein
LASSDLRYLLGNMSFVRMLASYGWRMMS